MSVEGITEVVRNKALAAGAAPWLDELPGLVADLEHEWSISVGRTYAGGTEAFVAEATLDDSEVSSSCSSRAPVTQWTE